MSLRRLRLAPVLLAAVVVLALGWGAGAVHGWQAHDAAQGGELISALRLEAPAVASGADERVDVRAERLVKPRWIPLAVAAALVAGTETVRRRHRRRGDVMARSLHHRWAALGRAPPLLHVTAP